MRNESHAETSPHTQCKSTLWNSSSQKTLTPFSIGSHTGGRRTKVYSLTIVYLKGLKQFSVGGTLGCWCGYITGKMYCWRVRKKNNARYIYKNRRLSRFAGSIINTASMEIQITWSTEAMVTRLYGKILLWQRNILWQWYIIHIKTTLLHATACPVGGCLEILWVINLLWNFIWLKEGSLTLLTNWQEKK